MNEKKALIKTAAEALRKLASEVDMLKLAKDSSEKRDRVLLKMVENGSIKTATEYIATSRDLEKRGDEDMVDKMLDMFPEKMSAPMGKVAMDSDEFTGNAADRFNSFLLNG